METIYKKKDFQKDRRIIDFILLCMIIRPHPTFIPTVISVYLFDFIIIVILLFISRFYISGIQLFFVILLGIQLCVKSVILGLDADTWLAYFKIIYYIIVYNNMSYLFATGYSKERFDKILNFCFGYIIILSIIQLFDFPIIGDLAHSLYGINKLRTIWSGYPRIYSTFFNANWFGVYLVFMLAYYTVGYLKSNNMKKYIIQLICIVLLLLASGSRTAIIGSLIAVICILIMNRKFSLLFKAVFVICGISVIGFLLVNKVDLFAKTLARFTSYFSALALSENVDLSIIAGSRWPVWVESWNLLRESPLYGNVLGELIPHNTYIILLIRFGIIGTMCLLPIFLIPMKHMLSQPRINEYRLMGISFILSLLAIMMSGDYLFTTQVMLLPIILLSMSKGLGCKSSINKS